MAIDTPKGHPYRIPESTLLTQKRKAGLNDLIQSLIRHPRVERLSRIRFLGTMSILYRLSKHSSRLDHALGCAYISMLFAETLALSQETTKVLVLFSLLHDIGHTPFSHAVEPLLRDYSRVYHEGASSKLLAGLISEMEASDENIVISGQDTESFLDLLKTIKDLLRHRDITDSVFDTAILPLIEGPISIDTLDGIARTAVCLDLVCPSIEDIISGFYLDLAGRLRYRHEKLDLLLDFWQLKSHIYSNYVFSLPNQSGEAMMNRAVELALKEASISWTQLSAFDDMQMEDKIRENPIAAILLDQLRNGKVLSFILGPQDINTSTQSQLKSLARSMTLDWHQIEKDIRFFPAFADSDRIFVIIHFSKRKSFNIAESFLRQPRLFVEDYDVATEFPRIFQAHRSYDFVGVFAPPFCVPNCLDRRQHDSELAAYLELVLREADI